LFSVYEGIHKLNAPEPATSPWLAVAILVFSILAESVSLLGCLHEVNKVRGDLSLWRWFRESRQSDLLVVLGGCPIIGAVARESGFEAIFSIK